ncbi:MAG: ATP-binding cassette domain-containing protein [Syntrophomonadaceae bacterium]|jgi:ABC-2 type transport system ATP-binding protein
MDTKPDIAVIAVKGLMQVISKQTVLENLDLKVQKGEWVGIFGSRGSGKSTLLHILAGIDRFKSGQVEILGGDPGKTPDLKKRIGLVTQRPSLFRDLTTGENLEFIAALKDASQLDIKRVVHEYQLEPYLKKAVMALDAGVYQRASLACALLNAPELLILDEIIKDIDLYSRHLILNRLGEFKKQGNTLVSGFSNIELHEHMDRVGWLENREIIMLQPEAACAKWHSLNRSMARSMGNSYE